jgi:SAM-dependent methyltransferase
MVIGDQPVLCNMLSDNRSEALAFPRGEIRLGLCRACGHVFNMAFRPEAIEYREGYENSLFFSPRFQRYSTELANHLIERYDLRGKVVVEIGSGTGEFLRSICEMGRNRGVGFDPSYRPTSNESDVVGSIEFIQDSFSERYGGLKADLVCSRHVLEHIHDPIGFMRMLRESILGRSGSAIFYIEVPNGRFVISESSIWDIIYEHCSYFSSSSLRYLFQRSGFDVLDTAEAFGGQFLRIEATPRRAPEPIESPSAEELRSFLADAEELADEYESTVAIWRRRFDRFEAEGKRVAVWGAGSKGVTFLNTLKPTGDSALVVDINPRKVGKYIPGTGHVVMSPESLQNRKPAVVIVMNRIYGNEIGESLRDQGIRAEILFA